MNDKKGISKHDQVLAGLVFSLQAAAYQHLGKIASPLNNKVERDMEQARGTIDILEMLKVKCRQDTAPEILQMLDKAVMELQMNYLDELKKEADAPGTRDGADSETSEKNETDAPEARDETSSENAEKRSETGSEDKTSEEK